MINTKTTAWLEKPLGVTMALMLLITTFISAIKDKGLVRAAILPIIGLILVIIFARKRPEADEHKTYLRYVSITLGSVFTFGLLLSMACYQQYNFGHIDHSTSTLLAAGAFSPIIFYVFLRRMDGTPISFL